MAFLFFVIAVGRVLLQRFIVLANGNNGCRACVLHMIICRPIWLCRAGATYPYRVRRSWWLRSWLLWWPMRLSACLCVTSRVWVSSINGVVGGKLPGNFQETSRNFTVTISVKGEIMVVSFSLIGCLRRIWLGCVSCSLFPIWTQSQRRIICRGKKWPKCHF